MIKLNEEQKITLNTVKKIVQEKIKPRAAEIDETAEFPKDILDIFTRNGLLSPLIPEKYGGINSSLLLFAVILEEIAKACASSALMLISQTDGIHPILFFGDEDLKNRFLPAFTNGKLAAFAATEPWSGSDIQSMRTRAVRKGDCYVINGQKTFITNAPLADVISVFAYTDPDKGPRGISVFAVEKGSPGLAYGKNERKMGMRGCLNSELFFDNLVVPARNRIGQEGEGFKALMKAFETGRVMTAAQAVGLAQGAIDEAVKYAKQRVQFGKPIYRNQAVQFMIADMVAGTEAARLLTYKAALSIDEQNNREISKACSIAKFMASDNAMKVTTDAVQILGGYGYMKDYPVERMMRDVKLIQIYTGTNQIMRMVTAREILRDY